MLKYNILDSISDINNKDIFSGGFSNPKLSKNSSNSSVDSF